MKGIFRRSKSSILFNLFCFLGGIALLCFGMIGLFIWKLESAEDRFVLIFMVAFSLINILLSGLLLFYPGKREFYVDENSLHINDGIFSKLDCSLDDVSGVQVNADGTLTINLRNGKLVGVLGLANQLQLQRYINRILTKKHRFKERNSISQLQSELFDKARIWKRKGHIVLAWLVLSVICLVFILVNEKPMDEFSKYDWLLFILFLILGIINFIAILAYACKAGNLANEIQVLRDKLKEQSILSSELPDGIVYKVFASDDLSERITVMKSPGSDKVYYIREIASLNGDLLKEDMSHLYSSFEELLPELEDYIEIQEGEQS
ncbi:MAG: hypothetical protein IJM79_06175 [Erysipelotrichaceae bacterium]|nr:hypothetical protein [Erysipelotrichaceae bacterium]